MRLGMCNELFEGWDLRRTCRALKDMGYDGIEIAPFTLAPTINDLSETQRREACDIISDSGLVTIGTHWLLAKTEGLHLTSPDPAVRKRTSDYLVSLAEATRDLGGDLMVLGSPKQRDLLPGVNIHDAMHYAADVLSKAMPAIAAAGVDLCLEPLAPSETNFLNTIADANVLLERLDSPHARLHLDVKAMSGDTGGTVTSLIARHGAEARHFHAQDPGNLRGPGMGETDFGTIMRALVASGYDGWISVEVFDYSAGPEYTAEQSIECLRRCLASARHHA